MTLPDMNMSDSRSREEDLFKVPQRKGPVSLQTGHRQVQGTLG